MKTVDFYFDLSSPYSYLAATQLAALERTSGCAIAWKPMVLAAVFKSAGNTMPAACPPKAKYMLDDLGRWARQYGVEFRMTSRFPVNAIKPMRLVLAAEPEGRAGAVALAAFRALWVNDRAITDGAELRAIAKEAGLDPERALAAIETPEIKDRLRAHTDAAVRRGAFGAPAIFVDDQLFWGNDRLHFVEAALR